MNKKNKRTILSVALCLVLLGAVGITLLTGKDTPQKTTQESSLTQTDTVKSEGAEYKKNTDLTNVLFLGIDKEAKTDLNNYPGYNGQSDSLNLLICNKETGEAEVLQISRETMVEIEIFGVMGDKVAKEPGQICLQFAFGDGDSQSCRLTVERVSELLYGVDITKYIAITLDGMIYAADAIGGVEITIPEDYTAIDPAFQKGATIILDGEMTEKYVRSRDIDVLDSNVERMARQADFIQALIQKLQTIEDTNQYMSLYQELEPYMITNMTADEMYELSEYHYSDNIHTLEGETIEKEGHAQFIVDNERLQKKVLELFYKQK